MSDDITLDKNSHKGTGKKHIVIELSILVTNLLLAIATFYLALQTKAAVDQNSKNDEKISKLIEQGFRLAAIADEVTLDSLMIDKIVLNNGRVIPFGSSMCRINRSQVGAGNFTVYYSNVNRRTVSGMPFVKVGGEKFLGKRLNIKANESCSSVFSLNLVDVGMNEQIVIGFELATGVK